MTYSMYRTRDNAGDSGQMSDAYYWPNGRENGGHPEVMHNARPFVGAVMRVGSHYARSFHAQDWWQTTPITEITDEWEETDDTGNVTECVRFKTGNSTYIWKKF